MYKTIFAIDEVLFKDKKNKNTPSSEYTLNNYNYYEPKLDKDFYLNLFIKKSLFDIDIIELDNFLFFQYENSKNNEKFIKILKFKIIPSIDKIIRNSNHSFDGISSYYKQVELEDGFIETEGKIKHPELEFRMFYNLSSFNRLTEDLEARKFIILEYIKSLESSNNINTINWSGKPSHLAFLIRTLVDEGYIEPPVGKDKEINHMELSRQVLNSFNIKNKTTLNTIRMYLNSETEKHIKLRDNFNNQGFNIPNSGLLG